MEPFGKTKKTQCEEWVKRDNAVIAPCQHIPFYDLVVDEAKGDILVDLDNNRYIDFLSSASSLNIGSRRPEIVQAITEQMNKKDSKFCAWKKTSFRFQMSKLLMDT